MKERRGVMTRRIRRSAVLLLLALAIELASLMWRSPLAFFLFLIGAGGIASIGIGSFLLSLVSTKAEDREDPL